MILASNEHGWWIIKEENVDFILSMKMDNKPKDNIRSVVIYRMEILRRHMRRKAFLCLALFAKEDGIWKRPHEYGRELIVMLWNDGRFS